MASAARAGAGERRYATGCRAPALAQLYGLTPAEGRLAAVLLAGKTPGEHATAAGVSIASVRTQLHVALAKTGTRRQAELVCLLANIPHLHG